MDPDRTSRALPAERGPRAQPAVIVSCDGHIGPLLEEQLRAYCPAEHLDAFDAFAAQESEKRGAVPSLISYQSRRELRNLGLEGHHDLGARVRDMDVEGVAAEVLFHGSQNGHTLPFMPLGAVPSGNPLAHADFRAISKSDLEMYEVGQMIYNRWLADQVAEAPDRLIGLVHVPFWAPERAAAQVEWGRENGLRGVNFPAPRPGVPHYADPVWDGFWGACAAHGMPLNGHAGAGDPETWDGPHGVAIAATESAGWPSRRAMHFMIFGGAFERFPDLRLILTEQPGTWWLQAAKDYDSIWIQQKGTELHAHVPRAPSHYMSRNVYIGASFVSAEEVAAAVDNNYVSRVLWGRDYPHNEGTFQAPEFDGDPPQSPLALRDALSYCSHQDALAIVGLNAVEAFGLDGDRLRAVAERIGAPSAEQLVEPIDEIPDSHGFLAFRRHGAYS